MKRPRPYRWFLYGCFVIARILLPLLPLRVSQWLGRNLGRVAFWCLKSQRELTLQHLRLALGDAVTAVEQHHVARRAFEHLGMNGLEWLACPKLNRTTATRWIAIDGMERVEHALARGNGIIFISAHFGNWELLAAYFGLLGFRGGVVARRLRYPEYESWLIRARAANGVETFVRDTNFKELVRRLKNNQCIGIMPDQDVDSVEGVHVEFFGRPTYTPTGPAALALLTGAAMLPAFIVREDSRFRILIDEEIPVRPTGDRARDMQDITQAWSRVTERYIRQFPDHWVWMHRRWKTQPQH